jgi:hypothetical protein
MAAAKKYCIAFLTEKEVLASICTKQFLNAPFLKAVLKMAGFFHTFGGQTGT